MRGGRKVAGSTVKEYHFTSLDSLRAVVRKADTKVVFYLNPDDPEDKDTLRTVRVVSTLARKTVLKYSATKETAHIVFWYETLNGHGHTI